MVLIRLPVRDEKKRAVLFSRMQMLINSLEKIRMGTRIELLVEGTCEWTWAGAHAGKLVKACYA